MKNPLVKVKVPENSATSLVPSSGHSQCLNNWFHIPGTKGPNVFTLSAETDCAEII